MRRFKLKIALIVLKLVLFISVSAQVSTYGNLQNGQIEMNFRFEKIDAEAHSTIFNILTISNKSIIKYSGDISISVPRDWKVIGESNYKITIPENDSITLPVRVSISKNALGEIGYSVMANLTSTNGSNPKSAYFYVTIPRKTELIAQPKEYIYYIAENKNKAIFPYKVNNKGNIPELVHLELKPDKSLYINEEKRGVYVDEFGLEPYVDTTLNYAIYNTDDEDSRTFKKIDIHSFNNDTSYLQTVWFKILKDYYRYKIPENQKCAIIEFNSYNIFSSTEPNYTLLAKGSILFKKDREFYYSFYTNFREREYIGTDLGYFNSTFVGYKTKYSDTRVGSVQGNYEQSISGIGAHTSLNFKRIGITGTFVEGIYSDYTGYGGALDFNVRLFNLNLGAVSTENRTYGVDTRLGFAGTSINFLKYNSLSIIVGGSEFSGNSPEVFQGYGLNANYNFRTKKLRVSARARYGSPYYTGIYGSRMDVRVFSRYAFSNRSSAKFTYDKLHYRYFSFIQSVTASNRESQSDRYQLSFISSANEYLNYEIGLINKLERVNNLYVTDPDRFFTALSPGIFVVNDIRFEKITFTPRLEVYQAYVQVEGNPGLSFKNGYTTLNLSANIASKNIGVYTLFKYGANSIYEHYVYSITGEVLQWLFLMPYYKKYFFNKRVMFDVRGNYINNLNNNERTFNLNTQLTWFLPRDFTIRLQNTVYSRSRIDLNTNIKYSYSNIYFEAGIRKEFNCNQPRFQYHDVEIIFYRDINGDRIKNKNEPGISNVLAEISRDADANKGKIDNFNETQFLSNELGSVQYDNIQNGFYVLKYQLLNEIVGNFSLEQLTYHFKMDKDKVIYIPYHENNKIIGKVIMNRDPLSSLGDIDISNIRVIAEDTRGHSYSALTDRAGNFVLYTPQADHYVVRINNIFYESFDLQQPEFIVKFNGYKQFEVTFMFTEKKRKINFSNDITEETDLEIDEFKVIKKTTLTGKLRDAISLEPIEGEIKIIDNRNNSVVASAKSNKLNGNYTISYVAGDHFRVEVKAEGHWDHVENLYIEQIISIQNIAKDIMMNKLSDGPKKQTFIIYDEKEEDQFTENFKAGQKIPMNNLNFGEKETRLSPNSYPELDRLIDLLEKNKTVRIEVAGHADDSGKERIDNLLARRRARAVAQYLTSHGLKEDRIVVKSYSNKRPIAPGDSEKVKQRNRRVEIIVL